MPVPECSIIPTALSDDRFLRRVRQERPPKCPRKKVSGLGRWYNSFRFLAVRVACNRLEINRRKPVGARAQLSCCAPRAHFLCIVILLWDGSRRASLTAQRKRQFPLADEAASH